MAGRDRKILIGVGVSLALSAGAYYYNAAHDKDLVANAKYKAVPGGLEDSMHKMEEGVKQKPEVPNAEIAKVGALVKEPKKDARTVASVIPIIEPARPFKDEVHLSTPTVSTGALMPTEMNNPPPAAMPYVPPTVMGSKLAEIASSDTSLYLRFKANIFRVSLRKGMKLGSPQLAGFSGQRVETVVSDDVAAACSQNCYQLSEKLVGQLKDSKTARTFLKTQGWFLVSDQDSEHCDVAGAKKLTVTQDIEGKCILGMVSEGHTLHMAGDDHRSRGEVSSVMIMQKVASREPASE